MMLVLETLLIMIMVLSLMLMVYVSWSISYDFGLCLILTNPTIMIILANIFSTFCINAYFAYILIKCTEWILSATLGDSFLEVARSWRSWWVLIASRTTPTFPLCLYFHVETIVWVVSQVFNIKCIRWFKTKYRKASAWFYENDFDCKSFKFSRIFYYLM